MLVTDGAATAAAVVPSDTEAGLRILTLVASPSGTTVTLPIEVEAGQPVVPAWDPKRIYLLGDQVSYRGSVYTALWWTRDQQPGASPWGPWAEVGKPVQCAVGTVSEWTDSWIYLGGEIVEYQGRLYQAKWWLRNSTPYDSMWAPGGISADASGKPRPWMRR